MSKKIRKTNKKLSLGEVNSKLMKVSNQIEDKMKMLQERYKFDLNYSFKPITIDELKSK